MAHQNLLTIQFLKERLAKKGVDFASVTLDDRHYTVFSKRGGRTWFTSDARIAYPFLELHSRQMTHHKDITYALAKSNGVQIPETLVFTQSSTDREAQQFLARYSPLVVKPSKASISRGLTRDVTTNNELTEAIAHARQYGAVVLLQRQVQGDELRFTVVKGKVVSAIARLTPRVIGDGIHTLGELIIAENKERAGLDLPYITYPPLDERLIDVEKFNMQSIPAVGEIVELSKASMIRDGASFYEVKDKVHPSYLEIAEKMAAALNMDFVAVDILIDDYTVPATTQNYAFLECNESPVLRVYYSCRDKKYYDILEVIIPMIDEWLSTKPSEAQKLLGAFESVSFPKIGIKSVVAKVDTGAYSGALFCTDIKVIKRDGTKYLTFRLFGDDQVRHETAHYAATFVRSASGHRSRRYLVDTSIIVRGREYPITIGLSDRSDMKYPVLLGRRFLRAHSMIVDVRINQSHDKHEEKTL